MISLFTINYLDFYYMIKKSILNINSIGYSYVNREQHIEQNPIRQ